MADVLLSPADIWINFALDRAHANSPYRVFDMQIGQVAIDIPAFTSTTAGVGDMLSGTVTVPGVAVGDLFFLVPPSTIDVGLIVTAAVETSDTIRWKAINRTGTAAFNPGAATYRYLWLDIT